MPATSYSSEAIAFKDVMEVQIKSFKEAQVEALKLLMKSIIVSSPREVGRFMHQTIRSSESLSRVSRCESSDKI